MTKRGRRLAAATVFVAVLGTVAVGCTDDGTDVSGLTTGPTPATGATSQTGAPPTTGASTGPTTDSTSTTGSGGETSEPTSGATSGPSGPTLRTPSLPPATTAPTTAASESPLPGGPPASTTMSGTWSGQWTDPGTGVSSSLVFSLDQSGSDLTGSLTIDGTSCLSGGVLVGEAHGTAVRFDVKDREVEITYDGTLHGTTMSGEYFSTCDAPRGTWSVVKQKQ